MSKKGRWEVRDKKRKKMREREIRKEKSGKKGKGGERWLLHDLNHLTLKFKKIPRPGSN